jgi:hypothetical protein
MGVPIGAANILGVLEIILRVEAAHFSGNLAIVGSRIECLNFANATDAVLQVVPERIHVVANGRDNTHSRDDNSAIHEEVTSDM